jgi:hypothetical protein
MSALANLGVADGAATPVTHIFSPKAALPNPVWREDSSSVPLAGQASVVAVSKLSKTSDGMNRVSIKLAVPVMEAIMNQNAAGYTAAPKVAYTVTGQVEFILPMRSTQQDRKNVRTMLSNLLKDGGGGNTQMQDLIDTLAIPY